jgi:hypothetical protein
LGSSCSTSFGTWKLELQVVSEQAQTHIVARFDGRPP